MAFRLLITLCLAALLPDVAAGKDQGKELRGILLSYMQLEEVHPDSLERNIDSLKQCRLESQDVAQRAVYAAAIGRLYAERMNWRSVGTDLRDSSVAWYGRALADKQLLARTKAKRWKPLVVIGRDEDYFGGDMLNVVWRSMVGSLAGAVRDTAGVLPKYKEMVDFYRSVGRREGALLLMLEWLDEGRGEASDSLLLSMRDEYADLPLCAEVYLRLATNHSKTCFERRAWLQQGIDKYPKYRRKSVLQNALTELSDPQLQWHGLTETYPGKQYVWKFTARNVQSVRINGEEHRFPSHDPIETFQDSIVWTAPAPGSYRFEFVPTTSAKLKEKMEPLTQWIRVVRLAVFHQVMPDNRVRILVLDAETGKPQEGVGVAVFDPQLKPASGETFLAEELAYFRGVTDGRGKVLVPRMKQKNGRLASQLRYQISSADGQDSLPGGVIYLYNTVAWKGAPTDSSEVVHLFTDRGIYRPGQIVHASGIALRQLDWEGCAVEGQTYNLELLDAEYKVVEERAVTTDDMGVFSSDFELPVGHRNGYYQLRIRGAANASFRVEEYKRPTFEVVLEDSLLVEGDSCLVRGVAHNYDGTPLRGARVTGTYSWRSPWLYYAKRLPQVETLPLDTLETDDDGRFAYKLGIKGEELSQLSPLRESRRGGCPLLVNVDVLSQQGETHNTQHWYWRHHEVVPNPQHEPTKVDSTFLVRCLPDTLSSDRPGRIEVTTTLKDVYLHYTLAAAGKVWADTMVVLSEETRTFTIPYRKEYDQSVTASFCFAKSEQLYADTKTLYLALPDKQLKMRWDTFRDLLQPGQQEEWRLTLLNPDGTPARANLMAAMYDASLDYFEGHEWHFALNRSHRTFGVPFQAWLRSNRVANVFSSGYQKTRKERDINLSCLDPELFQVRVYTRTSGRGPILFKAANARSLTAAAPTMQLATMDGLSEDAAQNSAVGTLKEEVAEVEEDKGDEEENLVASVPMRENFHETAFFYPRLHTDGQGQVSIAFTLPESLTRWNFLGVAHTKELNFLNLRETVEARKDLMAQLYLPRFLRPGDEAVLTATVRNVSDLPQSGKGVLQILDAKTERVVKFWRTDISLVAQRDTVLHFPYEAVEGECADVIIRWAVEGTTCSDGEQRLLPILPATLHVTNTIAITAYNPSVQQMNLTELFPANVSDRRLTLEYTTHPQQLALQALPPLAQTQHKDVLSLAAAYYAGVLGKALGVAMPDSTEAYLSRIQSLQAPAGGFRWYPEMPESPYLTREVCYLFTRLRMMTQTANEQCSTVNEKAVHYLLNQRIDSTYLSVADLRNLYIAQYSGVQLSKEEQKKVNFLLKLARREDVEEEGYERQALLGIILKQAGSDRKARKCVNAFRKYIVSHPDRGSYIEFPKGSFTSIDRKLHIHVQLMEALQRMNPEDTLLSGMRRYLLQQKRTQEWATPVNTANAVFALMQGEMTNSKSSNGRIKDLLTLTRQHTAVQNFTAKDDTLGYLRDSMEIDERTLPVRLRLQKFSKGESWGGIYADFEQPFDQVAARSEGLSIRQEYPREAEQGNRYTVRYYISADRDYEYVTLIAPRPAFTEPVNQRSGYGWSRSTIGWSGGLGYYRQVHDATTEYSFHQIPRGDYLIEETLYVERGGRYHSGVSVIRCEYAEEFQGHSGDCVINVNGK